MTPAAGAIAANKLLSVVQAVAREARPSIEHPTRILLLYRLAEGPQNVGELAAALKVSQPTISRHPKVLRERGMVTTTRYGATVEYRLIDDRPIQALDLLRSLLRDTLSRSAELVGVLNEATESESSPTGGNPS